jgi:hypothetical protein
MTKERALELMTCTPEAEEANRTLMREGLTPRQLAMSHSTCIRVSLMLMGNLSDTPLGRELAELADALERGEFDDVCEVILTPVCN